MAKEVAYLYNDYFKDITAADITIVDDGGADKEDADYEKENAQNEDVGDTSRSDDKTNIKIRFDINSAAGGSAALKGFGWFNHNCTGGSIKIYSYTANDYATGQNLEDTVAVRALDMFTRIAAPSDRRYWEWDISHNGTATAAEAYYEWGRLMCYTDLVLLTEIENYERLRAYIFKNIIHKTKGGVRWAHKVSEKQERFGLNWSVRTQATLPAELRTMYESINGNASPFLFVPDIDAAACYHGYAEDEELNYVEYDGTGASEYAGQFNFNFIESVRGKA